MMKILHTILSLSALSLCIAHGNLNSTLAHAQDPKPTFILTDYSLFVDGVPQAERVGTMGGRVFWFCLPEQGHFIISPEPYEGYRFEKAAQLRDNTISFTLEGKLYQWTSTAPILSDGGEMEMWVLHDDEVRLKDCSKGFRAGSASSFKYFLENRKREENR